jgi:hypothetical protein
MVEADFAVSFLSFQHKKEVGQLESSAKSLSRATRDEHNICIANTEHGFTFAIQPNNVKPAVISDCG